jgi:hypothetical protein
MIGGVSFASTGLGEVTLDVAQPDQLAGDHPSRGRCAALPRDASGGAAPVVPSPPGGGWRPRTEVM